MSKIVFGSLRESAGKTSLIVGLAKGLQQEFAFIKPFGDRLLYRKKRLWDYDAALITNIFGLSENPEGISIGFDHSKLRYMYDEDTTKQKLNDLAAQVGGGGKLLLAEGGRDMSYGISVHLDAKTVAKTIGATLVMVIAGDEDTVLDDITYINRCVNMQDVTFGGVIVNKIKNMDDYRDLYEPAIKATGIPVLGAVPYREELTYRSVGLLADRMLAKVIAGEGSLNQVVKNIVIGSMSASKVMHTPLIEAENKLFITSGDRDDMILAAMETGAVGIVLTNNILPPSNLIAQAAQKGIPMLLVTTDTFHTAKQIDDMEPLLTQDETGRIELLATLAKDHVNLGGIL